MKKEMIQGQLNKDGQRRMRAAHSVQTVPNGFERLAIKISSVKCR
jgi:hypothetical protein